MRSKLGRSWFVPSLLATMLYQLPSAAAMLSLRCSSIGREKIEYITGVSIVLERNCVVFSKGVSQLCLCLVTYQSENLDSNAIKIFLACSLKIEGRTTQGGGRCLRNDILVPGSSPLTYSTTLQFHSGQFAPPLLVAVNESQQGWRNTVSWCHNERQCYQVNTCSEVGGGFDMGMPVWVAAPFPPDCVILLWKKW